MGFFGGFFGGGSGSSTPGISYTVATDAATAEAIRDRIYTVVEGITPESLSNDKFRRYRNEGGADFDAWATKNVPGAFRRLQVREIGDDELPETSSCIEERVRTKFEIRVAYPQTHRYGRDNAMDRDDVINEDWKAINLQVGIYGARNFTGTSNCIIFSTTKTRDTGTNTDYLVITLDVEYIRSVA